MSLGPEIGTANRSLSFLAVGPDADLMQADNVFRCKAVPGCVVKVEDLRSNRSGALLRSARIGLETSSLCGSLLLDSASDVVHSLRPAGGGRCKSTHLDRVRQTVSRIA